MRKLWLPAFVLCLTFTFAAMGGDMNNPGAPAPLPTPDPATTPQSVAEPAQDTLAVIVVNLVTTLASLL